LRFALGCCWATRVITLEHAAAAPLATAPVGMKRWADAWSFFHLTPKTRLLSRRSLALCVVLCLHIAVFYALLSGLAIRFSKFIPPTTQIDIIQVPHPRDVAPPLPPLQPPRVATGELPLPKVDVALPDEHAGSTAVDPPTLDRAPPTRPDAPPTPPTAAHPVSRTQGGPGTGFPNPDDYYPMLARHLAEQGIATVRVCVDAKGRLGAEPATVASSGSTRLDAAALQLAKAGSGHYRPTIEDGRPVDSCYDFRIRFQLKN
jgi:protein TonB